jgi:hypothetical protein
MNPILPNITVPQRMHDTAADSPLGVLADLTSEIAKEHPLAVKVDRILCAAMRLTKADFGVVGLLNADADQMRTLAHQPARARHRRLHPRNRTALSRTL